MLLLQVVLALLALLFVASNASIETQLTYIVHMDRAKITALDLSLGGKKRWYESVMDTVAETTSTQNVSENVEDNPEEAALPKLLYVYESSISGFAAKLTRKQFESLRNVDGYLHAYQDDLLSLHTTHSPQFLGLQQGKGLWSAGNLASDVIVGIVDTGIWPEHASFLDANMPPVPKRWKGGCEAGTRFTTANCNKKIIGARAFFKGYEAVAGRINETLEYRSPRDSQGHGTHTASTAAGNIVSSASFFGLARGTAAGMRFTGRIAAYKVCWPRGCPLSDILAAIEQAVADGVDVLSLSLGVHGNARPYYQDPIAIAAFSAMHKGVIVLCSAGNEGPSEQTVSNPAPWITTVAASYLDRSFPAIVKLGDGRVFTGASIYSGRPTKALSLVYGGTAGRQGAEFCTDGSLSSKLVQGKIVVCDRGMNSPVAKGEQVQSSGGAGMLLLNTDDEGEEILAAAHVLPVAALGSSAAKDIRDYTTMEKNPTVKIIFQGAVYDNVAPTMAAFSSRGPSSIGPDIIKPDVTAPGVNILAAWPPAMGPSGLKTDKRSVSFNILSGTSMSCPHVSGLAALLRSRHREWSPAAIKSALMTTAYTHNSKNAAIGDAGLSDPSSPATPFAFGSGHVDPEQASNPGLVYDIAVEDYLEYLCRLNYTAFQLALFVGGANYDCPADRVLQAGDLNYPSFALLVDAGWVSNTTATYRRTVTNVGPPSSKYVVFVTEPSGVDVMIEPRVLSFSKVGEKKSYNVTFVARAPQNSTLGTSVFGELVWVSGGFTVRSPVAVTWQQ